MHVLWWVRFASRIWKIARFVPSWRSRTLYLHALGYTHRRREFERLEFLGDRVLDLLICQMLYEQFPHADEGKMSLWRAWLCSRETLDKIALRTGLHHLIAPPFQMTGGKHLPGNVVEAFLAAIFLDRGLKVARAVILRWMQEELSQLHYQKDVPLNYKGRVYAWAQKQRTPIYFETRQIRKHWFHSVLYINGQPVAEGEGDRKKSAEENAARRWFQAISGQEM